MKSDTHKQLQEIVRDYYRKKGWIAIIEHYVEGKKIDVLAQDIKSKYTIANEIQLSPKHFIENVLLDSKTGCDEISIISNDKTILEQMKKASKTLDASLLQNIKFHLIEEFIPHQLTTENNNNIRNKAELNPELNAEQNQQERR